MGARPSNPLSAFLFGAGASFACKTVNPIPPLGSQLFGRLAARPPFNRVSESVRSAFETGFEQGMAALYQEDAGSLVQAQKTLALYLLWLDDGARPNLYDLLLSAVSGRRATWSSLNYDVLLECAASRVAGKFSYGFHDSGGTDILKLHGSANFCVDPRIARFSNLQFVPTRGGRILQTSSFLPLPTRVAIDMWADPAEALGPVMSLFIEGKDELVASDALKAVRKDWEKAVLYAESIVCIGVHIHEPDTHIWEPIAASDAKVGFVGPERAQTKAWADAKRGKDTVTTHLADAFDAASIAEIVRFITPS